MRRMRVMLMVLVAALMAAVACAKATPTPRLATPTPAVPAATATPRPTPTIIASPTPYLTPAAATPTPVPGVYRTYEEAMKDWPNVVAAAKKEGKVMVYSFGVPAPGSSRAAIYDAFTKKYGIVWETIGGQTAEAGERLKAEAITGKHTIDARSAGSGSRGQFGPLDLNLGEPFVPPSALEPGVPWTIDPLLDRPQEGNSITYGWYPMYILINTDLVPPEREPKKYWDLTDPWWKGKIVMQDIRIPGPQADLLVPAYIHANYGEKWLRGLLANTGKMYTSSGDLTAAVVKGEYALVPAQAPSGLERYVLLPKPWKWKLIEPEDGVSGFTLITWVIKKAPHPNAAKVFSDWHLTKEADNISAQYWGTGLIRRDTVPVNPIVFSKKTFPGVPLSMEFTWLEALKINEKKFDPLMKELGF